MAHDNLLIAFARSNSCDKAAEILAGVPDDEQAKIAGGNTARVYNLTWRGLTVPA
jgi:hypothetical protein